MARSSGEQGAATLALANVDLRMLPLPPSFNARPATLYEYLRSFGVSIYHGKELYTHRGLKGGQLEPKQMVGERMARDWRGAVKLLDAREGGCEGGGWRGAIRGLLGGC